MFISRVHVGDLGHRLDSSFYNPRLMAISKRITDAFESRALDELVDPGRRITNGVRGPDWQDSEYKLIRLQDCKDWVVDAANAASISLEQFQENRRCKLGPEDIVVAIGGYVGNAAVFLGDAQAVIGQHSAVLPARKNGPADSRFLLTYLNSYYGESLFQRFVSGTVQPGVNLEDLRGLPAPLPHNVAQRYIGNRVRQAERLRAQASSLTVSARVLIESLIEGQISESQLIEAQQALDAGDGTLDRTILARIKPDGIDRIGEPRLVAIVRIPARLLDHRLDARYNSPEAVAIRKRIRDLSIPTARVDSLVKLTCGPFGSTLTADEHDPNGDMLLVQPTNISGDYFEYTKSWRIRSADAEDKGLKSYDPGTLLFARVGVYPHVGVLPHGVPRATISSSMIAGESLGKLDPHYAFSFFRSSAGYKLLLAAQKITAQPTIGTDEIGATALVLPHQYAQRYIGDKVRQAEQRRFLANSLAVSAKLLVESLIDNQLTESQLIAAQQALEAGDDTLDRAILARLKTDGIDGSDEPLFPDLDQLYDLLSRATREATADDV